MATASRKLRPQDFHWLGEPIIDHKGIYDQVADAIQLSLPEISQSHTQQEPRKREAESADHDRDRGVLVTCCGFGMVWP